MRGAIISRLIDIQFGFQEQKRHVYSAGLGRYPFLPILPFTHRPIHKLFFLLLLWAIFSIPLSAQTAESDSTAQRPSFSMTPT